MYKNLQNYLVTLIENCLTFCGRTSIVKTYGTGISPTEAINMVNDNPYIGTQLHSGNSFLNKWCEAKISIPIPVPIEESTNRNFRPIRSIRIIVTILAANCTIQIIMDDSIGVSVEPACVKNAVVYA